MTRQALLRNSLIGLAALAATLAPAASQAGGIGDVKYPAASLELAHDGYGSSRFGGPGYSGDFHFRGHRRGPDYGRHYPGRRHASCSPREAIEKAYWMGLRRPAIERITPDRIVVAGSYRHWARIVFARWTPHCRVIAARGV